MLDIKRIKLDNFTLTECSLVFFGSLTIDFGEAMPNIELAKELNPNPCSYVSSMMDIVFQ